MAKKLRAALIGATGLAGQQFIAGLKNHPYIEISAGWRPRRRAPGRSMQRRSAPERDAGWFIPERLPERIAKMKVRSGAELSGRDFDVAFSAVEADVARELEPGWRRTSR